MKIPRKSSSRLFIVTCVFKSVANKLFASAFVSLLAQSAFADTVTLRADNWCPYNCDPKDKNPGFMIEIAKFALENAGHKLDYKILNWARTIEDVRAGKIDGIIGASKTETPDFVFPSEVIALNSPCFFSTEANKNSWKYSDEKSLEKVLVGVTADYTYGEPLDSHVKKYSKDKKKVDFANGDNPLQVNIKKLEAGRLGVVAENEYVFGFVTKDKKPNMFANVGCLKKDEIFVAFSPKNPKSAVYAKLVSDAVLKLRSSGELKKILSKYALSDWK